MESSPIFGKFSKLIAIFILNKSLFRYLSINNLNNENNKKKIGNLYAINGGGGVEKYNNNY